MAPEQSLREKLANLWKLQQLDNEIIEREEEREKVPELAGDLDVRLKARRGDLTTRQAQLRTTESDLAEKQRLLNLERIKLKNTRNKETAIQNIQQYEAFMKEIEVQSESSENLEKQIKALSERRDTLTLEIEDLSGQVQSLEKSIAETDQEIERRCKDLDAELDALFIRRDEFVKLLDPRYYRQYEFIAERVGDGVAVAKVVDGHCGACNMQLLPQMANEILAGKQFHACMSCSRILIFIEETEG